MNFFARGKGCFILILLMQVSTMIIAQEPPAWYLESLDQKAGEWLTDNQDYKNDQETTAYYSTKWWRGVTETDLYGILQNDEDQVIWSYYQFYDPQNDQIVVLQNGLSGVKGRGTLTREGDTLVLMQSFKGVDGSQWEEVHHTTTIRTDSKEAKLKERTTSFRIGSDGNLIKDRTYVWEKITHIKL